MVKIQLLLKKKKIHLRCASLMGQGCLREKMVKKTKQQQQQKNPCICPFTTNMLLVPSLKS